MNYRNIYWYFKKALSDEICNEILKIGIKKNKQVAIVGDSKKIKIKDLKKIRNSNIAWLDYKWIYKEIHPYIHTANKNSGWNFQWDYSESCQFTKYSKKQFYDWHQDTWEEPYNLPNEPQKHGKIRKLSVSVLLSDPNSYEGGELEFHSGNIKDNKTLICDELKEKGSIVVFPSFIWHRVKPVTKGTRYSLVIWNLGLPYI
jgi:PKHD-type hydroxylase